MMDLSVTFLEETLGFILTSSYIFNKYYFELDKNTPFVLSYMKDSDPRISPINLFSLDLKVKYVNFKLKKSGCWNTFSFEIHI